MKKSKRILSAITALAISASAFASMVIPASAADDGSAIVATKTFEDGQTTGWTTGTSGRFTPVVLEEASGNHFLSVNQDERNNNGCVVTGTIDDFTSSRYVVEFDMKIGSSNNQSPTSFAIDSLFTLTATGTNATTWKLNGNDNDIVTLNGTSPNQAIADMPWYHFAVAYADGITYLTITDKSETPATIFEMNTIAPISTTGKISKFTFTSSRYLANFAIDNIQIRNPKEGEIPQINYYTVTANTTQFATMKYTITPPGETPEDEKTAYSGADGVITIPNIQEGSDITYTISKTGYVSSAAKTYAALQESKTDNITLELDDDHSDCLYFETDFANATGEFTNGVAGRSASTYLAPGDGIAIPSGISTIHTILSVGGYGNINTGSKEDPKPAENPVITMAFTTDKGKFVGLHWQENATGAASYNTGMYAWSGWLGSSAMQDYSDDSSKMTNSILIDSTLTTDEMQVNFTVDMPNKLVTVQVDDRIVGTVEIPEALAASTKITGVQIGQYRYKNDVHLKELWVDEPDPDSVLVTGEDLELAKIADKTRTQTFKATPVLPVAGEGFTWSVTNTDGSAVGAGVSIDPVTGVLSVTGDATPGTVRVTATSDKTATKKGYVDVVIHDYADLTPTIEGPKAVEVGYDATYKVTKIVDEYGDDVTEYYTPVWTIDGENTDTSVTFENATPGKAFAITAKYDNTELESVFAEEVTIPANGTLEYSTTAGAKVMLWKSLESMEPVSSETKNTPAMGLISNETVATVSGKSGEVTTYNEGNVDLTVTLAAGQTATYPVKVDNYYIIDDYDEQSTYSVEELVQDTAITGYLVTLSDADDVKVAEQVTDAATAQATGAVVPAVPSGKTATQLEITPVFTTTVGAAELLVPADTYNIVITANNANRADVYVNDQMIVNNLNQGSVETGGKWEDVSGARPETATYTYKDIYVKEGSAKFKYEERSADPVTSIEMYKAPTIVERTRKVYAIGDSLVCNYYDRVNAPKGEEFCRTGWGQVINNYLKDVDVVNLGNSGAWATGMYATAFTQVRESAQPGDIVLWESGYNDRAHSNETDMKAAITAAVNECKAMGVDIYLITPNASAHDLKTSPNYAEYMRDLSKSTGAPLIDLAQLSFDFLDYHYGPIVYNETTKYNEFTDPANAKVELTYFHHALDSLHSTRNAANVWASLVAGALYDAGETDIVNTEYTYTFTDTKTTPETFNIKVTPSAE